MSESEIEEEMEKEELQERVSISKGGMYCWRRHPYRSGRNSSYRRET
ncbi:MAG: hypothetical protein WBY71_00020 [Nitrososphaeraceae archaeon]